MNGQLQSISKSLLDWFAENARELPWRNDPEPYPVWISEIMLQQTRVATVIPYYHAFLARFPSIEALAEADLEEVLAVWSGLGYYRRARTLHRAARSLAPTYVLPTTLEGLLEVPGIGRYTAGAIASIAHGIDAPIVDGNVIRVISRLFALEGDPYASAPNREIWRLSEALIPPGRASDFNQGLMELGALVCVPRGPRCPQCPVASECIARGLGTAEELPERRRRGPRKSMRLVLAIVRGGDGRVLMRRRPEEGLFGGMWEFPSREVDAAARAERVALEMATQLGVASRAVVVHPPVVRQLTHRELVMTAVELVAEGDVGESGAVWIERERVAELGLPAAFLAVASQIGLDPC